MFFVPSAVDSGCWLEFLNSCADKINLCVWGLPLITLILGAGALITLLLRFVHLTKLGLAFRLMFRQESEAGGEVSQFASLCTALSATIGTGNIVGVATAVGTGGPGALFWMEVAAFLGMATKYAEGFLAIKYRHIDKSGSVIGGPFYYIERGLSGTFGIKNWKFLAKIFAFFGMVAGLFGIGTITQVNGISSAVQRFFSSKFISSVSPYCVQILGNEYSLSCIIAGVIVTLCVALVVIGGIKRISTISIVIVPFMAITYVIIVALLLLGNLSNLPYAVETIIGAAFNPAAFTGGMVGSVFIAMQRGIARGIFSNEAGLGSAPIAAAAAKTNEPVRQGLVCMTGTFIDTIVICTMTGLAIVVSGAWEPSLGLEGVEITVEAFRRGFSFLGPASEWLSPLFLMLALTFFAFTTILGWNYYSEKCLEYLIGRRNERVITIYRIVYVLVVFAGPYLTVSAVWSIADICNGLMAIPNIIALILLSPMVACSTLEYFRNRKD